MGDPPGLKPELTENPQNPRDKKALYYRTTKERKLA